MCVVTTTQYKVPTDLTRERYQVISIETFVSPLQVLFIIPRILLIFYQNECSKTLGPRPSSYKEQKLPSVWKHADVTPLPKVKQVVDPKKELRPISLTASLSKVAEDFVGLVLSTALGLRPRAVLKTSGTVFSHTDLPPGK